MGEQDLLKLQEALKKGFPRLEDLSAMVKFRLGENLYEFADTRTLETATNDLIAWAERENRLLKLLDGAVAASENSLLQATVTDLKKKLDKQRDAVWYQPPSEYKTCLVQGEAPFVNRKDLRDSLEINLSIGGNYSVLAVNGPPGTGKSHSLFLITYVARFQNRFQKTFKVAAIDLKFEGTYQMKADEFTRLVAQQLRIGLKDFPKRSSPADKWVRELESWLVGLIPEKTQCWLVLDGFRHKNVPVATRSLIHRLIRSASTNVPELRIVLLDYPKPMLPLEMQDYILQESVSEITRSDLIDFFKQLYLHKGRNPKDPGIGAMVDEVIAKAKVPAGQPGRNRAISAALAEKIRSLFAGTPKSHPASPAQP
jgi:hypothetical protein